EFSQTPGLPYGPQCNGNRSADFAACGARIVAESLLAPLDSDAADLHIAVYQWADAPRGWAPCWPAAGAGTAPDTARFPTDAPVGSKLVAVMASYRYSGNAVPDTTLLAHAYTRAAGAHAASLCQ